MYNNIVIADYLLTIPRIQDWLQRLDMPLSIGKF